ncbi:MAG: hypothetical protein HUJ97_10065, partial [Bacteroidales bacterium]|nr:hypothetical protein [Bacteroidales bacterium]
KRTIKIAAVAFIAAMGILVAYNATNDTEMNDLQNENLEALAGKFKQRVEKQEPTSRPHMPSKEEGDNCVGRDGDCFE